MTLSVIVVNYNVREFLQHALTSLQKALRGLRSEILVVDNGSDDGSVEMLRRRFASVQVIANKENVGFARANNQALQRARGKYFLLINPDTVVREDTVRVMLDFFERNRDVGMAGCQILNPDGSFQLACRRSFPTPWVAFTKISGLSRLFPRSRLFGRYNLTYLSTQESYELDAISGSFMMLRREVFETVGGLDERFFMYGEDLDWCLRIQQSGWKIYYVHETQIIHYKGESTKRSGIDEIKTFYEAMRLFVRKHFRRSGFFSATMRGAITVTSWFAMLREFLRPLGVSVVDIVLLDLNLLLAEFIWIGEVFHFPTYAYPIVYTVPAVLVIGSLYAFGVYTHRRMSVSRTIIAVVVGYVLISALVAFFKQYAFSRMVILLSGALSIVTLPGWRLLLRILGRTSTSGRKTLFGRRTLIVGTGPSARRLLQRLRRRIAEGYQVIGFIDTTRKRLGSLIDGVPVVGSLTNVGKMVQDLRASDVIFSTGQLSYADILSVISRTGARAVNYHLVPDTMEVIIGKASIDSLNDLPLVEITYNLERPLHRLMKRVTDIVLSAVLLISIYPFVYWKARKAGNRASRFVLGLPAVFVGTKSLVGPSRRGPDAAPEGTPGHQGLFLGKPGLTGLVELQSERALTPEEVLQYDVYYARNQSFLFDLEILLKTWSHARGRGSRPASPVRGGVISPGSEVRRRTGKRNGT